MKHLKNLIPNISHIDSLKDTYISLLQFGRMGSEFAPEILDAAFERRVGLALKKFTFGIDLAIPLKKGGGEEEMAVFFITIKSCSHKALNDM